MPAKPTAGTETGQGRPRISVVIPVLNEARDLGLLLDDLRGQAPVSGGVEVLVADGGSTDGTRDLVTARTGGWPHVVLLANPGRRSSAGRNVGARAARGDFVVFLDGHCRLPRGDYLARAVELFTATGADCLCRAQPLDLVDEAGWAVDIARARHSPLGHAPGSDIYGGEPAFTAPESAGAAYRREVLERLGGFDERFDACEDVEFNHRVARAGFTAYRHPDLAVSYRPRDTLAGLFRQMRRYGRGRAHLAARHPDMIPVSLVAASAAAALWCVAAWTWGGVFWAAPLVYALVCALEAARLVGPAAAAWRTAAVFPVIHGGLVLGFWRGLLEAAYYRPEAPGRDARVRA